MSAAATSMAAVPMGPFGVVTTGGVGDFPEKDHRWLVAFRQADPAALGASCHWTAQYGTPERRQAVRVRAINHQVAHDKAHALSIAPSPRDLPLTD